MEDHFGPEDLITTREAAQLLDATPREVRLMVYRGVLPCVRLSDRTLRVPRPMVLTLKSVQEGARHLVADFAAKMEAAGTGTTGGGSEREGGFGPE
jgi:hypothetical protein